MEPHRWINRGAGQWASTENTGRGIYISVWNTLKYFRNIAGQCRAGQGRAGQGNAGQSRAARGRVKQGGAVQRIHSVYTDKSPAAAHLQHFLSNARNITWSWFWARRRLSQSILVRLYALGERDTLHPAAFLCATAMGHGSRVTGEHRSSFIRFTRLCVACR